MKIQEEIQQIRDAAEADLETFIRLVAPYQVIPDFHKELINFWTREDAKNHQLTLIPRDHGKSRLVAFRVAWELTKNPALRILYISATSNLAEKQLGFIKNIFISDVYRRYWPEMVNKQESKRAKWTTSEIELDHPLRRELGIRDPSIFTAGLTTGITGMHCDISVLDDIVVQENALTQEGRTRVSLQYSLLSSIEGAGSKQIVVGTRYHPKDLYQNMLDMKKQIFSNEGELLTEEPIYEVFERKLENVGDGTGQYLWARDRTLDGRWFGFDQNIRAEKYAKYEDKRQFWAQYYNTPNPPGEMAIDATRFQYYDNNLVKQNYGQWYFGNYRLNVYAAIDFAFSMKGRADSTAIVVVGIDSDKRIYVLDIIRFKSDKISDYYKYICAAHSKWGFRKLRAEVSVGQAVIVKELKEQYIRPNGLAISIDEFKPNRHQGTKQERIAAILEPRYDNLMMWHYRGGNCSLLEEELVSQNPVHDDIKDALASCVEICIAPAKTVDKQQANGVVIFNKKWGGIA